MASVHQTLFPTLPKADPDIVAGGDPGSARAIIRVAQNIVRHSWGDTSAPPPKRA